MTKIIHSVTGKTLAGAAMVVLGLVDPTGRLGTELQIAMTAAGSVLLIVDQIMGHLALARTVANHPAGAVQSTHAGGPVSTSEASHTGPPVNTSETAPTMRQT